MPSRRWISIPAGITLVLLIVVVRTRAQDDTSAPAAVVTIKGNVICNRSTAMKPWNWDPNDGDHTPVMFALKGTPEIAGHVQSIMNRYPERGLDVDDALRVQDEFAKHLKFFIAPGPIAEKVHKEVEAGSRLLALTGTVARKDGKNWITVTRVDPAKVNYPARMLAPDQPFSTPAGEPLALKINDRLTLQCIPLPAGRFLAGSPFYQRRYQDEYPHEIVLTRPFYMSEIPITQEIYEAVMGTNPSLSKGAKFPVERVALADIQRFCRILSEKNGVTVRLPTDAEWEYAARVGTSNPCFTEKYNDQRSETGSRPNVTPVRSRKPNAWGLYDMLCGGWHVTNDYKADNVRVRQVDPKGPAATDKQVHRDGSGRLHKTRGGPHYDHSRPNIHGAATENGGLWEGGSAIFRIVVEAPTKPRISKGG